MTRINYTLLPTFSIYTLKVKSAASEKRIKFLEEEHDIQVSKLRSNIRRLEREIDDKSSRLHEIEEENFSLKKRLKIAMRDIEDSLAISTMLEKSLDFDRRSFTSREAMVKEQVRLQILQFIKIDTAIAVVFVIYVYQYHSLFLCHSMYNSVTMQIYLLLSWLKHKMK